MIVDIDSTIMRTKTEEQDAAPTYKRTFGHHPLLAMCADTDEVLAGILRAGNAGANTAVDHVVLLADALAQLPAVWRAGHDVGDDPTLVERNVLVRADAAGASHWVAQECVDRNIEFSLGYQIDERVRDGVICVPTGCWHPAVDAGGRRRDGAEVVELTGFVKLDAWPARTRLWLATVSDAKAVRTRVMLLADLVRNSTLTVFGDPSGSRSCRRQQGWTQPSGSIVRVHHVCMGPVGSGDEGVTADFDVFFREEQPKMVAVALALTGVPEVARDLAQDALIEAARRWRTVSEFDRPGAWLRRVTINKSISWQRREAHGRVAASRLRPRTVDPPGEPDDEFWRAVRNLPPRQRTAIVLRYVDDASTADIAAAMDVTEGTVKATLSAARRSLAGTLGLDVEAGAETVGGQP